MNFTGSGSRRQKWVGSPVPAPRGDRGRSPSDRQRHYGSAELAGTGERVYVDDVVEVSTEESISNATSQPRLAQVQSMWEDMFTEACKFRARWLIRAGDLPEEARRSRKPRRESADDKDESIPAKVKKQRDEVDDGENEDSDVFLTPRTEEVDLRMVMKRASVSVKGIRGTEGTPKRGGNLGLRLTHTFCPASGEFEELSDGDAVVVRARRRQEDANATAAASGVSSSSDKESGSAKRGSTADGWLPQKGKSLATRGRGRGRGRGGGRSSGRGGTRTRVSNSRSQSPTNVPEQDASDESEPGPDPDDEPWEEGDDGVTDSDSDADFASSYGSVNVSPKTSNEKERNELKKSARQRRSQRSSGASEDEAAGEVQTKGEDTPRSGTTSSHQMPRRPRAPAIRRQGPHPPRPRRLAMPPAIVHGIPKGNGTSGSRMSTLCAPRSTPPKKTRLGTVVKERVSPSQSTERDTDAERPPYKRRKGVTPGKALSMGPSECPPRCTPVGKEYQAEIPDLLPQEKRKQLQAAGRGPASQAAGENAARQVWRSTRDWEGRSPDRLDEYIRAVKTIVEVKQARPGVAVHVRLGGTDAAGVDERGRPYRSGSNAGSYAIWAVTAHRHATGDVRVGCSETAQTEVPRSAIQRVSCEEEALTGLLKSRSLLNNFTPALQMFAKDPDTPQSIQPWTFTQVRTLEKALEDEFDPERRVHGWARPGMSMDREDFIDLAKVSKSIPGKSPEQVLAFYYKYLAAAEPLTDVLFGKEAAANRKSEPLGENVDPSRSQWDGQSAREEDNHETRKRTPSRPTPSHPPGRGASPGGSDTHSPPGLQGVAPRALGPKFPRDGDGNNQQRSVGHLDGPAPGGRVPGDDVGRSVYSSSSRRGRGVGESTSARNRRTPGDWNPIEARYRRGRGGWSGGPHNSVGGMVGRRGEGEGDLHPSARRRISMDDTSPRGPPQEVEVLEVVDDDSGEEGGPRGGEAGSMHRSMKKSSQAASSTQQWGLSRTGEDWDARRAHPAADDIAVVPRQLPSGILSIPPRPGGSTSAGSAHSRPVHPSQASPYVYGRDEEPGASYDDRAGARWERPQHPPQSSRSYPASHDKDPYQREPYGGRDWSGTAGNGHWAPRPHPAGGGRAKDDVRKGSAAGVSGGSFMEGGRAPYDPTSIDAKFGHMAPCWRLLEKARNYMEENQLRYMSGLIQTHVKKPMTREQLLERAQSCLHEQVQIFNAFVKMFDRIEEPPAVPFYPSAKHPVGSSSKPLAQGGRQVSHDAPPGGKEVSSSLLRVPPAPALAVEVSGVGSHFANSSGGSGDGDGSAARAGAGAGAGPGLGGSSVGRAVTRVPPMAPGTRQSPFVPGQQQTRGDPHPQSVIQHPRAPRDQWGQGRGGGGSAEVPVYPHRNPPVPMSSYGGGAGGSSGNTTSRRACSPQPGMVRGDKGFSKAGGARAVARNSWGLAPRKDGRSVGGSSSTAAEAPGGGTGNPGSPRVGPVRTYPGMRFESQQPRWRSDLVHDSPAAAAAAAAAEAAAGKRSMFGRGGHWGSGGGQNSWK